jgi:hypothetical protein
LLVAKLRAAGSLSEADKKTKTPPSAACECYDGVMPMNRRRMLNKCAALAAAPFFPWAAAGENRLLAEEPSRRPAPDFRTDAPKLQSKWDAALAGLAGNIGHVYRFPGPVLKEGAIYSGVWLESAPQEGLLYAPFNPAVAVNNHRVFFDLQRADGYLPYSVRSNGAGASQIQMVVPVAATALELAERLHDDDLLARAYRACSAWDRWLVRYRNTRGTGLCELFCGYDTGEDNSARFKGLPWKCPHDDARICPQVGALPYLAPDLSATVYGGRVALAAMAGRLGKNGEAAGWEEQAESIRRAVMKWCFDAADACFYDRDSRDQFVRIRCVELLVVLGEHLVDRRLFEEIYRRHIRNPKEFWTPYPFPSVAADDPLFNHDLPPNCWGGPSQVLTALRAPRWMEHYGKAADLAHFMGRWVQALTASDNFQQQVNPWTGKFSTGSAYSPAMLLLTDFVARLYGVVEEGGALQWNCRLPEGARRSRYQLSTSHGTAELSIQSAKGKPSGELTLAGKNRLAVTGAVRVVTGLDGTPLSLLGTEPAASDVVLTWPDGRASRHTVPADKRVSIQLPR